MTETETLIQFPLDFPIKVIGKSSDNFLEEIKSIVREHLPNTPDTAFTVTESAKKNFMSITVVVYVHDKLTLDNIYISINQHPNIKMVL